jgi:hypothetical protein
MRKFGAIVAPKVTTTLLQTQPAPSIVSAAERKKMPESHMYTNGVDIVYRKGRAKEQYTTKYGNTWTHSEFCQCHLENKLRGKS